MDRETLNMNQICRTCKNMEPQMCSLFEELKNTDLNIRIDKMLMACAAVQVVCGDGLPEQVCRKCIKQLSNAYAFKQRCEKVDINLREYAKNIKHRGIKQEPQNSDNTDPLTLPEDLPNPKSVVLLKTETSDVHLTENEPALTCSEVLDATKALLQKHGHKNVLHKCGKCNKKYSRLKALQKHEITHNQKKVYICKICSKNLVDTRHLRQHLIVHLKEKPSCNTCNRVFSRMEHLQRHTPRCKRDLVHSCDMCNKTFHREDSLELHKKNHDSEQKLPTIDNLDNIKDHYYIIDNDVDTSFSDCYDVDNCSETEAEQQNVTEKDASSINVNDERSDVSRTSLIGDQNKNCESNMGNVANCLENEFVDIKEVKVESTLEELDDTLICTDVEANTASKRFLCSECGKSFVRNDFLVIHMRRHSGEKPFKCKYCEKGFVRSADVVAHERCHTGEKPHLCTVCGRSFRWAYNLRLHMKTHNKTKSYQCAYCDIVFTQSEDLESHLQSHEGKDFQCQFSKRFLSGRPLSEQKQTIPSFSKKKDAMSHSKKCVEKKNRECTVCGKEFGKPYYLTVHMKTHTRGDNSETSIEEH